MSKRTMLEIHSRIIPLLGTVLCGTLLASGDTASALSSNVTYKAEVSVKESYDSNVYLQDKDPLPASVDAARINGLSVVPAKKDSFVTSIQPRLSLDYKPGKAFSATLGYSPDIVFYHNANSEDYISHLWAANAHGQIKSAQWDLKNSFIYIDGSKEGPTFGSTTSGKSGQVPAIGGIPLRNRRAAFIYKNAFKVTQPLGDKFMIRPVASVYVHDFKTYQTNTLSSPILPTKITSTDRTSTAAWISVMK